MTDTKMTIERNLMPAWSQGIARLEEAEATETLEDLQSVERFLNSHGLNTRDLFGLWFTDRGQQGLRFRKSMPKQGSTSYEVYEYAAAGYGILKWMRSGGDLTGLMMARFRVSAEQYSDLETLTAVVQALVFGRSRAIDKWSEVLGR